MDLQFIDQQVEDIYNGKVNIPRFNQQEHAGICSAGPLFIGALLVCDFARESFTSGCDASGCQGTIANWQIDAAQEQALQQWAEQKGVWVPEAEQWLEENFGPMIAQGAEAKVFARSGDAHVIKARTSIYATIGRAMEAIALHNAYFPETIMRVVGFTRDKDGLLRILLTQPYIESLRLATKEEIDNMLKPMGFCDNGDGKGVNYISDRLHLEDMHPANVFVEPLTGRPICIDCIIKFRRDLGQEGASM